MTTLARSSFVLITREQLRTRLEQADPVLRLCLSLLLDRLRSTLDQVRSLDAAAPGASAGGSGGLAPPDRARGAEAAAAIRLDHELEPALAEGQLELHYQPIVDLREAAGGQVAGFEALVRWRHLDRGLIHRIDAWVVEEACTAARRFEAARAANGRGGQEPFFVSVNVCGQDLGHAGFVDQVTRGLRAAGLCPGALKLEITETTLMTAGADEVLRAAKDRGIGVVLDDFGTGYSSLSYLQRFPIDALKLDRSFLNGMGADEPPPILVGIFRLAGLLGKPVVAEGVENAAQVGLLTRLRVAYSQRVSCSRRRCRRTPRRRS